MKTLIPVLSAVISLSNPAFAEEDHGSCDHPEPNETSKKATWTGVVARGEKLKGAPAVKLEALLAKPESHDGKQIQVEAKVRRACKKSGCWMELGQSEKGPSVRVTFKDYGFFVPLDSAGATAKVEGQVKVASMSEDMARHLAAEGATVPRDAEGKPREVQIVATGVELKR